MNQLYAPLLFVTLFTSPFHVRASSSASEISYLGVSAEFIQNFMKKVGDETLTKRQALEDYIKEATLGQNCPYQNLFKDKRGQDGRPLIQAATTLVSHAWKNSMRHTLETTLEYDAEHPGEHYYWLDIFAVNQHLKETSDDLFERGLREVTQRTKATLLILSPWNNPVPLTRAWCLWEIRNTLREKNKLDVRIPAQEKEQFREAILNDFTVVTEAMMKIDVQKAEATKARDKEMIFRAIESDPDIGFFTLNEAVKDKMRRWVADSGRKLAQQGEDSRQKAKLLLNLIQMYQGLSDFKKVELLSLQGLEIAKKIPRVIRETIHFLNTLGNAYEAQDEYDKALEQYKKAQEHVRDPVSVVSCYKNLGNAYSKKGEHEEGVSHHRAALGLQKVFFGEDNVNTAAVYNDLGNAYKAQGEYGEAADCYQKALQIQMLRLEENHPHISASYNNLGEVYRHMGECDRAISYHEKALEIRKHVLGENHPETIQSYINLGKAHNTKGEYRTAIANYEKALELQKHALGKNHRHVAASYNTLGNTYYAEGEYDQAISCHAQALEIGKHLFGENHLNVAISYNNMGNVHKAQGEYEQAVACYEKALEIRKRVLGENHPDTAFSDIVLRKACDALVSASDKWRRYTVV